MANIKDSLEAAMMIDGVEGVALVDLKSGMALGCSGKSANLDVEAAHGAEILKTKFKTLQTLGTRDSIEDMLITMGTRYHLLRIVGGAQGLMLYLDLRRGECNLGMARLTLRQIERELVV